MALRDVKLTMKSDGGSTSRPTGGSSRETKTNLVYNPKTGTWTPVTATSQATPDTTPPSPKTPDKTNTESVNTSKNVDSKKDADKEYIEAEFNILTGELSLTPSEKSIRIKVNDTVKLEGLGKYLSGLYFVSSVSRTINKDNGYSHSFFLIKNGFGSSVKKAQPVPVVEPRKEEVVKPSPEYKVGDKVKIVGDDAVYSNAHDGVKVPGWVKQRTHTIMDTSNDKNRVLLKEIFSWTYVKYLQKM